MAWREPPTVLVRPVGVSADSRARYLPNPRQNSRHRDVTTYFSHTHTHTQTCNSSRTTFRRYKQGLEMLTNRTRPRRYQLQSAGGCGHVKRHKSNPDGQRMSLNQVHTADHLDRPFLTLRIIQFSELPHVAYPRSTKEGYVTNNFITPRRVNILSTFWFVQFSSQQECSEGTMTTDAVKRNLSVPVAARSKA